MIEKDIKQLQHDYKMGGNVGKACKNVVTQLLNVHELEEIKFLALKLEVICVWLSDDEQMKMYEQGEGSQNL